MKTKYQNLANRTSIKIKEWYLAELCLMQVFFVSLWPFASKFSGHYHGFLYYAAWGAGWTIFAMLLAWISRKTSPGETKTYSITSILIMSIGALSILYLVGVADGHVYAAYELCLATYAGAVGGIVVGGSMFRYY